MASLIDNIENGLKTRLATISGLTAYARMPDTTLAAPFALVLLRTQGQDLTLAGSDPAYEVEVLVGVPLSGSLDVAGTTLNAYLSRTGASSIEAAIYGDDTLGGVVSYCIVKGWRDHGVRDINGAGQVLGALFDVGVQV